MNQPRRADTDMTPSRAVGKRYPALIWLWDDACEEFIPFLDYGPL